MSTIMKNTYNRIITLAAGLLLACLPLFASQTLPWMSTSSMQATHSSLSSQVTNVEAAHATYIPMRSTSTMLPTGYIPLPFEDSSDGGSGHIGNIRRGKEPNEDPGDTDDESSPVGEPWVLLLFAAAAAGVIGWRKRKTSQLAD